MNTLLRLFGLSTESERVRLSGMIDRLSELRCNAITQARNAKEQARKMLDQRKYYHNKATDLQLTVYQLESELRTQTSQNNAARSALQIVVRERDLAWDNLALVSNIVNGDAS